jgi:hypothetical protein
MEPVSVTDGAFLSALGVPDSEDFSIICQVLYWATPNCTERDCVSTGIGRGESSFKAQSGRWALCQRSQGINRRLS